MIDINNWLGKDKKSPQITDNNLYLKDDYNKVPENDWHEKSDSCCFLCISDLNDRILIYIHKDDNEERIECGFTQFNRAIEEKKTVALYNFRDKTYKKWNPYSKQLSEGNIPSVDFDSLIEVIKDIQNSSDPLYLKGRKFNRFFFAVIYKLLKDGVFGVENNDISYRDYVDLMNHAGLNAGQKSNLGEHLKKIEGKSPYIKVKQNDPAKSEEYVNFKVKKFIEEIISRYLKKES